MNEDTRKALAKFGSGRLFVVVSVLATFCWCSVALVTADLSTEIKLAVYGTLSTLATSIGKDYFNRDRSADK